MHIRRRDLDDWIKELYDRGINEFEFKELPDDLRHIRWLQKAKDLGLLESIKITNGRHTWKVMSCNVSKKRRRKIS